ncbi:hypothetical protein I3842_14G111600, partial [Carya illinoinensis]
ELEFLKALSVGTGPTKLLYDISKFYIDFISTRRSKKPKLGGIIPWKKFPPTNRISSVMQLPRLLGISPDNMFPEISNLPRFLRFPTSMGSGPVR